MDPIFMNSENSKASASRLLLNISDNINLTRSDKYVACLSIYYTWKNIKKPYRNNKLKISAPTWNEECELPDGSCSAWDTQDNFKYTFRNMNQLLITFNNDILK